MVGHPRIHGSDKVPAYAASPVRGTDTNVVQQEVELIPRTLLLHMTHQVADRLSVLFRDPMKDGRVSQIGVRGGRLQHVLQSAAPVHIEGGIIARKRF